MLTLRAMQISKRIRERAHPAARSHLLISG